MRGRPRIRTCWPDEVSGLPGARFRGRSRPFAVSLSDLRSSRVIHIVATVLPAALRPAIIGAMDGFSLSWKRTAAGSIVPVGTGVDPTPVKGASLAARAAALSGLLPEDVVMVRRTAAWIWGLDVLPPGVDEADWDIELAALARTGDPSGVAGDGSLRVPADHVVEEAGVRITSLTRTALDCARWLPRYEAVAALDQFLRRGVDPDELTKMARALPGYHGNKRLREAIRLSDRGAASPGESWTRVAVVKSGFPRPEAQVPVLGPHGEWLYVDLGYPEFRVGVEYDGERYHSGRTARAHDERRRAWLAREMGWEIIPFTKHFLRRPAPYLEALLTAMLQRGWTPDDATMERLALRLARLARRR